VVVVLVVAAAAVLVVAGTLAEADSAARLILAAVAFTRRVRAQSLA